MTEYIDQEWIDIYAWIIRTRRDKKLSISSFLKSCDLDSNTIEISSYCNYRGLVSESGRNRIPSKREGTNGDILRKKMIYNKIHGNFKTIISDRDKDFAFAIHDWKTDNIDFLRENSIYSISSSGNILEIREILGKPSVISHDALLNIIWKDNTILSNFDKYNYSTKSITVLV